MSEKLNEWTVFGEKYKELCEWLTNMESKVSQNGDISIEEMIEKLRKVGTTEQLLTAVTLSAQQEAECLKRQQKHSYVLCCASGLPGGDHGR